MAYSAPVMAGLTMETPNTLNTKVMTGCVSDLKHTASSFAGGKSKNLVPKKSVHKKTVPKATKKPPAKKK